MNLGGHLIVECLKAQGVERVFCVPGESYLDVLDGLFESGIDTVVARHEGGAAMMADADGKMTGRPGVCMVTRGPGATNASAGVHVAAQDSTPMILFVGQIARDMRGREAFQEVDYRAVFGTIAKWVEEIDRVERIPEVISHAWHVAMSGRPGPVVIALPEDMLKDMTDRASCERVDVADPAPAAAAIQQFGSILKSAKRPFVALGGTRWTAEDVSKVQDFAQAWDLPVGVTFRRQGLFNANHPNYAGDVGLGINPALRQRVVNSDVLLLLGARFSENPSQSFSLLDIPEPKKTVVHVHPGPEELGRIYRPTLGINATPGAFLDAISVLDPAVGWSGLGAAAHADYQAWTDQPPAGVGNVSMSHTLSHLRAAIPSDSILCNGAGNYAIWLHRFYPYQGLDTQLAPTSGSMGYGLPAAVAAACRHPDRTVVCLAGDGCFQMSGMEFGIAAQRGLKLIVLVCDNSIYGTIRMHQERDYPSRVSATSMVNPDFAAWARSYGALGITVESDDAFAAALDQAKAEKGPALLHLKLDPRDIAPGRTIDA